MLRLLTSKYARRRLYLQLKSVYAIPRADVVLVSYPKSGRTWLRAMLTRLYQQRYNLPPGLLLGRRAIELLNPNVLRLFITHDCAPLGGVKLLKPAGSKYRNARVIFLARHPLDVAVSHYHQVKYRGAGHRENLTGGKTIFEFVAQEGYGLFTIMEYMNRWKGAVELNPDRMRMIRYEELTADPAAVLSNVCSFIGADFTREEIVSAVEFGEFKNLRRLEQTGYFNGCALRPEDPSDPRSYKVRRGKVHGYTSYFSADELEYLSTLLQKGLDARFGYDVVLKPQLDSQAVA